MDATTTVLVVEDDPILRNLLGHTFSNKYHMLYATNGAEALALLKDNTPSLILLDLMMPDMDGFTFLEKTHGADGPLTNVPIIIVSNLGQQKDIERAKSLGATDYLVKAEVSIEEIIAKITEVLEARLADAPHASMPSVPPQTAEEAAAQAIPPVPPADSAT